MTVPTSEFDYVIIGTGAGGATAARVLADTGRSIVMLEEGPLLDTRTRPRSVAEAMNLTFRDNGTRTTSGASPFPVLQGALVGGTTAINSGIIWRMPDDIREEWTREHGLGELVGTPAFDDAFERIERELSIASTTPEVLGRNSELMAVGARALGLPGRVIARNVRNCEGNARCLQGCPVAARQSLDVSYVPYARERGAELRPLSRVERIDVVRGRAVGVRGRVLDAHTRKPTGTFQVRARRAVIVAAGVLHTPLLLHRAGLRGLVGKRFQAHPGCAVVGFFDEPVHQGFGASQGYEVPMRSEGFKLETLAMPPELLAARIPGVGAAWRARIDRLSHAAHWAVQVRMRAHGTVCPGWFGAPVVRYTPLPDDMKRVRAGLALLVRTLFAAGAREVSHGVYGLPPVFQSADQVRDLERMELTPRHVHLLASHLFGTACAGSDPATSVVAPTLETHGIAGLYVMDASVFPTNMGVNPQHSIMAVTMRAAEMLAAR